MKEDKAEVTENRIKKTFSSDGPQINILQIFSYEKSDLEQKKTKKEQIPHGERIKKDETKHKTFHQAESIWGLSRGYIPSQLKSHKGIQSVAFFAITESNLTLGQKF